MNEMKGAVHLISLKSATSYEISTKYIRVHVASCHVSKRMQTKIKSTKFNGLLLQVILDPN